jgi:hypothetical protein
MDQMAKVAHEALTATEEEEIRAQKQRECKSPISCAEVNTGRV